MLFTDVDILLSTQSLTTIRLLTIENHSVYFPIVFSLFKDQNNNSNNNNNNNQYFDADKPGYWRYFGYGWDYMLNFSEPCSGEAGQEDQKKMTEFDFVRWPNKEDWKP